MCSRLRKKIGSLTFRVWAKIAQPLRDRYQDFDTRMFKENEMDPSFPCKDFEGVRNRYFAKWGFKVSQLDAAYYSRVSGIEADHYVTRSMAIHFIYPYLARYAFLDSYMDKNVQKRILGLDGENPLGILSTDDIVYNSNDIFYNNRGEVISNEEALDALVGYGDAMILKPSLETFGGHGVIRVAEGTSREEFRALLEKYRHNFTFQKLIRQHPVMSQFNPSSVNTVRIVTYRNPQREKKVLYSCVRFGGSGSVIDNVCSGGGFTGLDLETGRLLDRKRYCYYVTDVPPMPDSAPDAVPCWDKIVEAALALHDRLPHFDIVGWDFAVTPDEKVLLLEYNLRPGVGLQQAVGPMFSKEDLDELMRHVSKVNCHYHAFGVVNFKDQPDKKTVHVRLGG